MSQGGLHLERENAEGADNVCLGVLLIKLLPQDVLDPNLTVA
jgi:hypothetical protein